MHNDVFITLLMALLIGCLAAYIAKGKGRSPVLWFFIGAFFGIFGLLALFFFRSQEGKVLDQEKENSSLPEVEKQQQPALLQQPVGIKTLRDQEWFYLDAQHQRFGPVAFEKLESLWKEGKIGPSTYVWSEGMAGWHMIKDLPLLLSFFG
jgi:hypothetical protein